ncbi:TonB-dependent siderophore receptor [Nitrobacter sp.]|uniref:TonB-dependent siderophore receptor n=1 Tax=Nitrobacter sp. TaxID=29420 RepID=UPI0029CAB4D3|nr:TonB-dependent siderophore receptor [Nitrobacter sp.]
MAAEARAGVSNRCAAFLLLSTALTAGIIDVANAQAPGSNAPVAAPAARGESYNFSIPPQPLAGAVSAFSRVTGIDVVGDGGIGRAVRSPGVSGNLSSHQALTRLLAGTGLSYRFTNASTVAIQRPNADGSIGAAPSGAIALDTIDVQGAASSDPGRTEGINSYTPRVTATATKFQLTPRETPQTVTVVTNQQMRDFNMTSVDDALKTVSGVFVQERGENGAYYYSRGFDMQSQFDGVPNPIGISTNGRNPQIDNAFIDRVEVLQGAAGLLAGAGEPGGTINLMRKRPTATFQAQADAQLSSWSGRRVVGDVSGSLTESGRVRGRLVTLADNSKSFVDYVFRDRRAVYGIVEADLTDTTMLEASVQYQRDAGRNQIGPPFAADGSEWGVRRSAYFSDGNSYDTKDLTMTTLGLTQQLGGDWQLKARVIHSENNNYTSRYAYASGELDPITGDGLRLNRQNNITGGSDSNAVDVYASGPFHLFGRKHEAAFGVNGSSFRWAYRGSGYSQRMPFNVYTFDPGSLGDVPEGTPYFDDTKVTQLGAYGMTRFSLTDALKLITGARVSNYKDENLLTRLTSTEKTGVVSPYAGLTYDLTQQVSVYASYSDIFRPQTQRQADGSTVAPVVGANYEVGVKGELLDKRLNVSAAVFRLDQTNLARQDYSVLPDPSNACGGVCYIAADKVVSQGVDLGLSGELSPGWQMMAGYTFVDSKYASGEMNGLRYGTWLPRHNMRLTTAYKVPGTDWTLGGNLSARSQLYLDDVSWFTGETARIRSGALLLVGLMAKYQINPNAELVMTVSNLFDKTYRAQLETKYYSPFGEPRRMSIALRYRF